MPQRKCVPKDILPLFSQQALKVNELYPILLGQAIQFTSQRNQQDWDDYQVHFVVAGILGVITQWIERDCREAVPYLEKELHAVFTVPLMTLLSQEEILGPILANDA